MTRGEGPGKPEVKLKQLELSTKGGELIDAFYLGVQHIEDYRRAAGLNWPKTVRILEFFPRNTKRCVLYWEPYLSRENGKSSKPTEVVRYKSIERIDGKLVEERTQITVNRANPSSSQDNEIVYIKSVDGVLVSNFKDSDLALEHASSHMGKVAS